MSKFSNGQLLELYDDPDADEVENEYTYNHYIEAVTGATFQVKVMLTTQFELHGLRNNDVAYVALDVDGQPLLYNKISRADLEERLLAGKPGTVSFESYLSFCPKRGAVDGK